MTDVITKVVDDAISELERRGVSSDELAMQKERHQLKKEQRQAEWKETTKERFRKSKRHPSKLELQEPQNADEPISFLAGVDDPLAASLSGFETSGFTDSDAMAGLLGQVVNAQPECESVKAANAALGIMNGIAPQDPIEGLLAAQMTVCHNLSMEYARRAMGKSNSPDVVERNVNRTVKLMRTFVALTETLGKYRNKGQQKITVTHQQVNVGNGGQAIVGNVGTGEG